MAWIYFLFPMVLIFCNVTLMMRINIFEMLENLTTILKIKDMMGNNEVDVQETYLFKQKVWMN